MTSTFRRLPSRALLAVAITAVTASATAILSGVPAAATPAHAESTEAGPEPQHWGRVSGTAMAEVLLEDRNCAGDATTLRTGVFTGTARVSDPRLDGTTFRLEFTSHINRFVTSGDPNFVADFEGELSFVTAAGEFVATGPTFGALEEFRVRAAARVRFSDGNTAVLNYSGMPYSANRGAYAFEFGSEVPLAAKGVSVASTGGPCRPGEVVYSGRSALGAATPSQLPEVDPPGGS